MTIQYLLGLPPQRRELLFDMWVQTQRDPSGARRNSTDIASAILAVSLAARAKLPGRRTAEIKIASENALTWYRRYKLPKQKRATTQRSTHHKSTPMQIKSIVAQMSASV